MILLNSYHFNPSEMVVEITANVDIILKLIIVLFPVKCCVLGISVMLIL